MKTQYNFPVALCPWPVTVNKFRSFISFSIILISSISSISVQAATIQNTLINGDIATITDDQEITLTNSKGEMIQQSTFACGTVSATFKQLAKIQHDLKTDPALFITQDVSYPLEWNHNKKHSQIKNIQELDKKFTRIFNKKVQAAIFNQNPYRLFANSNGNMIGNGQAWFCSKGIFVVNGG